METDLLVDIAAAAGQVASAALTIPAAIIAYFSYRTSKSAALTAEATMALERRRMRAELAPQIETSTHGIRPSGDGRYQTMVQIKVLGPVHVPPLRIYLERVDVEGATLIDDVNAATQWMTTTFDEPLLGYELTTRAVLNDVEPGGGDFVVVVDSEPRGLWTWLSLTCQAEGFEPWRSVVQVKDIKFDQA